MKNFWKVPSREGWDFIYYRPVALMNRFPNMVKFLPVSESSNNFLVQLKDELVYVFGDNSKFQVISVSKESRMLPLEVIQTQQNHHIYAEED